MFYNNFSQGWNEADLENMPAIRLTTSPGTAREEPAAPAAPAETAANPSFRRYNRVIDAPAQPLALGGGGQSTILPDEDGPAERLIRYWYKKTGNVLMSAYEICGYVGDDEVNISPLPARRYRGIYADRPGWIGEWMDELLVKRAMDLAGYAKISLDAALDRVWTEHTYRDDMPRAFWMNTFEQFDDDGVRMSADGGDTWGRFTYDEYEAYLNAARDAYEAGETTCMYIARQAIEQRKVMKLEQDQIARLERLGLRRFKPDHSSIDRLYMHITYGSTAKAWIDTTTGDIRFKNVIDKYKQEYREYLQKLLDVSKTEEQTQAYLTRIEETRLANLNACRGDWLD